MSAVAGREEITLSGPPRNTTGVVGGTGTQRVVRVELKLPGGPSIQKAYVRTGAGGEREIQLQLPGDTPPSTYRGEAKVGEVAVPVVVHVAPVLQVWVEPQTTLVAAEPGGRAEFQITVSNNGNVPVEIPEEVSLDLDDDRGQDQALGRALRARLKEGEHRVDRFFEELRQSHGGQGRVAVLEGAGPLDAGAARALSCRLEVPMTAQPGRSYSGGWDIGNGGHQLVVEVKKPASGTPRSRRRKTP
ncbi:MAG: hypothetical protein P8Z36_03440 [Gemmatimonadota bacterium]